MRKQKNKRVSIFMFIIKLILIIFIIYSLTIYSLSFDESNLENFNNKSILINSFSNFKLPLDKIVTKANSIQIHKTNNGETYYNIATLKIPSLNIEYPILSETSDTLLNISLTKYFGSNPNEVGNMIILGHNYKNQKFFSKLPKIKIGDTIEITDLSNNTLIYSVYQTDIIEPSNTSCLSQLTNGNTEITLITCYNDDKNRFSVKARVY